MPHEWEQLSCHHPTVVADSSISTTFHRLITVHDDRKTYDDGVYNDLLDYRSDQQHTQWHESMLDHRRQRNWPIVNVEFGYEHGLGGPADRTYVVVQSPEELCRRAWEVCTAGGYPVYYYTYTAWDVVRPNDTPPGYAYFKFLREFFQSTAYWTLHPEDNLTTAGFCLADPGKEYVVFLNKPEPFSLKIKSPGAPFKATWFHPFSGESLEAGTLSAGTLNLIPPKQWGTAPVALHVYSQ